MKTAKKSAPKATEAKATKKAAKAPEKSTELRKPQVRLLQTLAKAKAGMTRKQLAEKAEVDAASCTSYLGKVATDSPPKFPSLLSLKYAKADAATVDGATVWVYSITAEGRKALATLEK